MTAAPHTSSSVHHHGEQDTIVYAASGHGTIITNSTPSVLPPSSSFSSTIPDASPNDPGAPIDNAHPNIQPEAPGIVRHRLAPGDFAIIPAWVEHQEVNEGDEEVVWIITRSGGVPQVVNLDGWGGVVVEG